MTFEDVHEAFEMMTDEEYDEAKKAAHTIVAELNAINLTDAAKAFMKLEILMNGPLD